MVQDPIIEEVRAIRDEFAKEHGYDVKAIVAALQREEVESGRQVISLPPKRLTGPASPWRRSASTAWYSLSVRFEWDEDKAVANLAKHGVSFNEATTVFADTLGWTYPDPEHSVMEERWITIGLSEGQRILVIAHTEEDEADTIRIINARQATRKEQKFYEEKQRG